MIDESGLAGVVATLRAAGCVFAEDEAALLLAAAPTPAELAALVGRRVAGVPLEQILGWAEFAGLHIVVEPGVFVPRRRTELLLTEAAAITEAAAGPRTVVLDLCCGSGAVAVALLAVLDRAGLDVELYAADIEPAAVRCARRNLGARGRVFEGDLFQPLPPGLRGRVDLLVANAPYVPTDAIALLPPEARVHEPRSALDGGADGLDLARRIAAAAPDWLAPGGHLLIETSDRQAPELAEILSDAGLLARVARDEDLDATVVIGQLPCPPG